MSALAGFGDGQVNATISGLSLPGETFAPLQKTVENRRASGVPGTDRQQRRSAAAR
ncbi:hypothetical protein LNQ03_25845 [Klebsiella pneumoniae subsp. pneumoniae]|nr:hypothetical protein [Klebsiella pneumoniae subsp. pneumoniae]